MFYRTSLGTPTENLLEIVLLYLLLITPNATTFWNCRRRRVLSGQISPDRELWLTRLILRTHPRSNETIFHRQWVMRTYYAKSVNTLSMELELCEEIADAYRLHYGLWDYRRFLVDQIGPTAFEKELMRLDDWLSSHPTDASGWTYLAQLLERTVRCSVPRCKELVVERLSHVNSLLQSYPERECLWMFMRTALCLLKQLDRDCATDFVANQTELFPTEARPIIAELVKIRRQFKSMESYFDWAFEHGLTRFPRVQMSWTELLRLRHLFWLGRNFLLSREDGNIP
ncbi:protein prenyltransferase alpha subunit repeat containing protein 1 [Clonorchis sinensis]|uniref:Protein prenyltransferase alpha subunit repeat containing protein 1 n=1 Tax=Clonorchis sinensis TaxID=79923 RepID=G7Y8L6_CLOSI|nr:protein prenyltransferase alpha subunit repeat containing protein 1 [Clonorchis sinensis]